MWNFWNLSPCCVERCFSTVLPFPAWFPFYITTSSAVIFLHELKQRFGSLFPIRHDSIIIWRNCFAMHSRQKDMPALISSELYDSDWWDNLKPVLLFSLTKIKIDYFMAPHKKTSLQQQTQLNIWQLFNLLPKRKEAASLPSIHLRGLQQLAMSLN